MDAPIISSSITHVALYRSTALVTRRAKIETASTPGATSLLLGGLPIKLDDNSVQVRLLNGGTARIADLHVELDLSKRKGPVRTEAEESLRELQRKHLALVVARERERDRIAYLATLTPTLQRERDLPDSIAFDEERDVGPWLKMAAFVREEVIASRNRLRPIEKQIRDLIHDIAEARHRLEQEGRPAAEKLLVHHKRVRLLIEGEAADTELELSYLLPDACWFPQYELRVAEDGERAELGVSALIAQLTGDDWEGVKLQLSTADLRRSTALPEVDSWRIGKAQPPGPTGWRDLPGTTKELFDGYDAGVRTGPPPEVPPAAQLPEMPPIQAESPTRRRKRRAEARSEITTLRSRSSGDSGGEDLAETLLGAEEEVTLELDDLALDAQPPSPVGTAGGLGGAAAGPPMMKAEVVAHARAAAPRPAAVAEPPPPGEPVVEGITAGDDALAYHSLRMAGPDDRAARGELRAAGAQDQIAEALGEPEEADRRVLRGLVAAARGPGLDVGDLKLPRHAVPVAKLAGHFAVRYDAEHPVTVPADGSVHSVALMWKESPIRRTYSCWPSIESNVYEMITFKNPLGVPLLAGPARIYRGGEFIVDAPLGTTAPGEPIEISLGVEPSIAVARNTHFHEKTSGLMGGSTELIHTIEIEVRSKLARPTRVEIFERVPTSKDDDITIEVLRMEPNAEKYHQGGRGPMLRGGYRFALDLGPQEAKTCTLEYQITIPSKTVLEGGNRRD
ncbi:MAG: mucoidy inhibitor MuiA family protein [Planctomycetota bacterium]|nr:mucoidy inhibitor MuiA family protein [Planctomycetota bacterium]